MGLILSVWRGGEGRDRAVYALVWAAMAVPLAAHLWIGLTGPEPQHQAMNLALGLWATRLLIVGLAMTPIARLFDWPRLLRFRRTVGLFAFTYAVAHSLDYVFYAQLWSAPLRFWKRQLYIPVGILALLLMIPLAVTSADVLRRRMGAPAWGRLHRWVYAVAVLVVVHSLWERAIDYREPGVYAAAIIGLLIVRTPPVQRALARIHSLRMDAIPGKTKLPAS